jgi:biopolymer transport protein ExbB
MALVGLSTVAGRSARFVTAQDDSPSETAAEEPDDTGGSSSSKARPRSAGDTESSDQKTALQYLWQSGVFGFFIVLCSIVAVAFAVEHMLTIRRGVLMPDEVAEELEGLIREGRIDEAIEACNSPHNASLLSHVALAGLERYRASEFGFAEYRAAAEEAGEEQTARLYRKTEVLAVIGAIAPMLGLLGTVSGMIKSFEIISATQAMARPDQLAGGISEALITTYMGLVVAIPAMVAFSYFRNKIDSLVAEAGKRAEQILIPLGRRR